MREPVRNGPVLRPALPGIVGTAARRRQDRRNTLMGVAVAVLFHLAVVGSFWMIDRWRIRDIGEWSGPILVKIGTSGAPDLPVPDPGPVPEESDTPVTEKPPVPPEPTESIENPLNPGTSSTPENRPASEQPQTVPGSTAANTSAAQSSTASSQPVKPAPVPRPSRVLGTEKGNSYEMNFDGTEDEVGRAGAHEYITSYMPLPETLDAALVNRAQEYLGMSPEFIRGEIDRYWELLGREYVRKRDPMGNIPMKDRPYYWSLLANSLGYDLADADWRSAGMRPVVVEFTVGLSEGTAGAALTNFVMKNRTNDPQVDEAVLFGLSRWVYYNKTDHPIKGRITYNFDR